MRRGEPLARLIAGGLFRPKHPVPGADFSGRVGAVGKNVRQFQPGDEVFGRRDPGGFAEHICVSQNPIALKPANLTFVQAAAIPTAALTALQSLRDTGRVRPGHKVLINGASGGVGTFAVQLAKLYGAEVTGVDHTGKLDFMRSLGADHVVDYTREAFTQSGEQYDLILDLIARRSVFAYPRALKPHGRCYFVGGLVATLFQILLLGPWISRATGKALRLLVVQPN